MGDSSKFWRLGSNWKNVTDIAALKALNLKLVEKARNNAVQRQNPQKTRELVDPDISGSKSKIRKIGQKSV